MLHVQGKLLQNCFWGVTVAFLEFFAHPIMRNHCFPCICPKLYHLCKSLATLAIEIFGHHDIDWTQGLHGLFLVLLFCFVSRVFGCFSCFLFWCVMDALRWCSFLPCRVELGHQARRSSPSSTGIVGGHPNLMNFKTHLRDSGKFTKPSHYAFLDYIFAYCWLKHIEDNVHL